MIELDPSIPWEPPKASPPPRIRQRQRWIALVTVALITAGILVASVPGVRTEPVFTVDGVRVLSVETAGGRLIVGRFQPSRAGTQAEVLSLRDGNRLWSITLDVDQHLTFLTNNVMALTTETPAGSTSLLTVLDAATGEQLWQRARVDYFGRFGGRILAEDMTGVAQETRVVEVRPSDEVPVNVAPEQRSRRYVALDERTGATVWEVRVPKDSVADFGWADDDTGPAFMSQLSPTGLLQIRDLGTGGVVTEDQLDWSGTVSWFTMGSSFLGAGSTVPEQVQIAKVGERGTDVYDRGTGRLLWHWQPERSGSWGREEPYLCASDLYCLRDDSGLAAVDPRTGKRLWHTDGYNGVLGRAGGVLVVSSGRPAGDAGPPIVAIDARTGRIVRELQGWHVTGIVPGRGLLMWNSVDKRTGVLGMFDPRSGRITVFGKSGTWHGNVECHQDRNMIACLADGALSVWKARF